jgi:hypothetical protein
MLGVRATELATKYGENSLRGRFEHSGDMGSFDSAAAALRLHSSAQDDNAFVGLGFHD